MKPTSPHTIQARSRPVSTLVASASFFAIADLAYGLSFVRAGGGCWARPGLSIAAGLAVAAIVFAAATGWIGGVATRPACLRAGVAFSAFLTFGAWIDFMSSKPAGPIAPHVMAMLMPMVHLTLLIVASIFAGTIFVLRSRDAVRGIAVSASVWLLAFMTPAALVTVILA